MGSCNGKSDSREQPAEVIVTTKALDNPSGLPGSGTKMKASLVGQLIYGN